MHRGGSVDAGERAIHRVKAVLAGFFRMRLALVCEPLMTRDQRLAGRYLSRHNPL